MAKANTAANLSLSVPATASAVMKARTPKRKAELRAHAEYKAQTAKLKSKVWPRLLAAIDADDRLRIEAYAATGREAKAKAWAAVRARDAKASAKPKTAAKSKAKPSAKPKEEETVDLNSLCKEAGMEPAQLAAFLRKLNK